MQRERFLAVLTERILALPGQGIARVAVTGVDGAGKTRLADELAGRLNAAGLAAIRVSLDGFHNPRSVRYARGRHSPEGYYRDSFDLVAFRTEVLAPLGPGGSRRYRSAVFDHRTDARLDSPVEDALDPAVLIVDGVFLLRPELADDWDLSIFLDVPFDLAFERMALRDGVPADSTAGMYRRYREGQRLHFAECRPKARADLLVDYSDFDRPEIVADRCGGA